MKLSASLIGPAVAACLALSLAPCVAAPARHVRGTVFQVSGNEITVRTATGPVIVKTSASTKYAGVVPARMSDITAGTFIGAANVPGSGTARALEVVVFPPALKGTGEGDYPWDLPASGARSSSMTNGTVAAPKMSSMTNATVTHVGNGATKRVSLSYKGGMKTIEIPDGVPIVRIVPAMRSMLVPGAHVVVFPPLDHVSRIIIGEKGAVPPM